MKSATNTNTNKNTNKNLSIVRDLLKNHVRQMENFKKICDLLPDGRHLNAGRGKFGSNNSLCRHTITMMILGMDPNKSFSQLKTQNDRKKYWRVSAYLRGKTKIVPAI